jgi:hypothetical protein
VAAVNADEQPPVCIQNKIANDTLTLIFNEVIDASRLRKEDFSCELGISVSLYYSPMNPKVLQIVFAQNFEANTPYTLSASNALADLQGNTFDLLELSVGIGAVPQAGALVINEVLFNPKTNGTDFVELLNISNDLLELQTLNIANKKLETGAVDKSYNIATSYVLYPQQYVVLCTQPAVVREQYDCKSPLAFIQLAAMPSYPNEAGCVAILLPNNEVIDEFYYSDKMHLSLLNSTKGVSLERINPHRAANEASNWFSASQVAGFATPTYQNSQYSVTSSDNTEEVLRLSPNVFSPDGDGIDDVLFIDYTMPGEGYVANVYIYDISGRLIKTLDKNILLGKEGRILWDGVNNKGALAPIGVYIVFMEAHNLTGKVYTYKKICTLGARL